PMNSGSSGSTSSPSNGTASPTVVSEGRLSTSPKALSSSCRTISTTVRQKFGSSRRGPAISSWPSASPLIAPNAARADTEPQPPLRLVGQRECLRALNVVLEVQPRELGDHLEQVHRETDLCVL